MMNKLHGIIFAYPSDLDLWELTQHRNTCSTPYGGQYRVIDFMLSNMVNTGVSDVSLIVYANYQSLLDYVGSGKNWDLSRKHGDLRIFSPFGYSGRREGIYRGRVDALAGVRPYSQYTRRDYMVLAGGDLAVSLSLNDIFEVHIRNDADITVVCTSHPMGSFKDCDYFTIGAEGRIIDALVHSLVAQGCGSLEVYILSKQLLLSLVDHCTVHNISSFSTGVFQVMVGQLKIYPYVFDGYAARLQSVAGYLARSMELLNPEVQTDLFAPGRPVCTKDRPDPSTYYGPGPRAVNSLVADGRVTKGEVENSILFRGVRAEKGVKVSGCVPMQSTTVQAGAVLKYVITDENVWINPGRILMGHNIYPLPTTRNEIA